MRNTPYWEISADLWKILKEFVPQNGATEPNEVMERCMDMIIKYKDTEQAEYVVKLTRATAAELGRQHAAAMMRNRT